ncbi:MAG: CRISPR-associated endonuclease Cas2 [Thermoguttaceae bacterium]|nr:CRISPR-associated endonuclease Cas2 [Thermoguttaceae bacterium]
MERCWIVCYDIASPKRLRRIALVMNLFGLRVQRSVFECRLTDGQFRCMLVQIHKILKKDEDDIRFYHICTSCRRTSSKRSNTIFRSEEKYYIV